MPIAVPKKPKKKPETLSRITNRLDALTSKVVRLRDKKCVVCGSTENLQCGHFISRVFINTRWCLTNCNTQCAACNRMHEYDPMPYVQAMTRRYGMKTVEGLSVAANNPRKLSRADRLEIEARLKAELARLEGEAQ